MTTDGSRVFVFYTHAGDGECAAASEWLAVHQGPDLRISVRPVEYAPSTSSGWASFKRAATMLREVAHHKGKRVEQATHDLRDHEPELDARIGQLLDAAVRDFGCISQAPPRGWDRTTALSLPAEELGAYTRLVLERGGV